MIIGLLKHGFILSYTMGVGRQFRMAGHLLDRGDSSMCNKHHEVGLIASSELE